MLNERGEMEFGGKETREDMTVIIEYLMEITNY
jgi:hypothetical protein